ncbi:hypothetical protein SETIT_5G220700v2 [Setaria italica]|uniref:Uncharacterized protein n=2 Tax=Setaria TaxID=4554 RepID=A0A368R7F8_SETIT|nr:hypothetical protein SETIT_5G220700v2 [Setaria italica]
MDRNLRVEGIDPSPSSGAATRRRPSAPAPPPGVPCCWPSTPLRSGVPSIVLWRSAPLCSG